MKRPDSAKRRQVRGALPAAKAQTQGDRPSIDKAAQTKTKFLTPTEVADRLLVAPVTVRLWASKGWLQSATTLGGHRRFREEDVETFVRQHQHMSAKSVVAPHGGTTARILIIDDDPQFARYLSGLISARLPGAILEIAHDGFSAGIKCQTMQPDIVTLDLQMPDMNGFDVCLLLRSTFGKTRPRIIALTGFASQSNVDRIMAAGADVCIAKTASADVLLKEFVLPSGAQGKRSL